METSGQVDSAAGVIADVSGALDRALVLGWKSLDDTALLAALESLPGLRVKLDALAGQVGLAAQQSAAVHRSGSRTAAMHVGASTSASAALTRGDVRCANWLEDFAEFRQAHAAGLLSRQQIDVLRNQADRPQTHFQLVQAQEMLVDFAQKLRFDDFKVAVQYWVNAADPDGEIPKDQIRKTSLSVRRNGDGSVNLKGFFDPLMGTAIWNAIERETQKLFAAEADARTTSESGDEAKAPTRRSSGRRRAEAFMGLVGRGARRGDGTIGSPLINVVASSTVAADTLARLDDPDIDVGIAYNDPDGRCEFIDGTPMHPTFLLATLGVATLRRHIFNARSRPDVSLKARDFPQWMKNAALVESRGRCSNPGCDAPFHWLEGDHVKPHSKGGPTSLSNIESRCRPDNQAKSDVWHEPAADPSAKPKPAA